MKVESGRGCQERKTPKGCGGRTAQGVWGTYSARYNHEILHRMPTSAPKGDWPIFGALDPSSGPHLPARRGVAPYASLEHMRAVDSARRATGRLGCMGPANCCAIGGTAQLALRDVPVAIAAAGPRDPSSHAAARWSCWWTGPGATPRHLDCIIIIIIIIMLVY